MAKKNEEPVMGIPYNPQPPVHPPPPQYHGAHHSYQSAKVPPNAVLGDPKGIPLQQTIYRDTPAPINCVFCGSSGLTNIKSKPSLAAFVGCMVPFMVGVCFLVPAMDCLWHKYHYCPHCNEKLAEFEKNDACAVMDPPNWWQQSFALPA